MSLGARWVLLSLLFGAAAGARLAWLWQADELEKQAAGYERQLAQKDQAHSREREAAAGAALDQLAVQQDARRDLEDRLQTQDKNHWKEMNDANQAQARLHDRLATADLRLSVLLTVPATATATATSGSSGVREASGSSGVVHGGTRAELDPAHAQRIIAITGDGDEGLIALRACQAYVREIVH